MRLLDGWPEYHVTTYPFPFPREAEFKAKVQILTLPSTGFSALDNFSSP